MRRTSSDLRLPPLGVRTISCGCFERCGRNKKIPPYHSNLSCNASNPAAGAAPCVRIPYTVRG